MRICPSCGHENGDDRDFCRCGEYLRWEPTQHVEAVTPAAAGELEDVAAGTAVDAPPSSPAKRAADPNVTLPPSAGLSVSPHRAPTGGDHTAGAPPPGAAMLLLRLPEDDDGSTGPLEFAVTPGERATVLALIRNESGVVDNYDLKVKGLPDGWWSAAPPTVYLVPFGTSGTYEQEIQIVVQPPHAPDAHAKPWPFEVVAYSRAFQTDVASAPASVRIAPYHELTTKVAPDRASGRLKARFLLTVRNRANAPVEVLVNAEDTDRECQFRFAAPSITIDPGRGVEAPFTVIPPKQIWIGRAKDRLISVTATPVGDDQPQPPRPVTYRQRSWLPWWLSVLAPIVAAIAAAVILLIPKQTVVPNLKPANSAFAAGKLLVAAGLKLSPQIGQVSDPSAPVGSIVDQNPSAGKKVKRGSTVSIEVAVGAAKIPVPPVVGLPPATAAQELSAAGLQLGTVSPPNDNANIASEIPGAGMLVAKGTPVAVFLPPPPPASKKSSTTSTGGAGTGTGTATATSGGGPGKLVAIPAIAGASTAVAAQRLSQAGFVPTSTEQFSSSPAGTLVGTNPPAGTSVPVGGKVQLIVSAGWPQLSYDNGTAINVVGAAGKPTGSVPSSAQPENEASWSADGTHLVFVQGPASAGQLMWITPGQKGAQPTALTGTSSDDHDPAFAPTTSAQVLGFINDAGGGSQLCFAVAGPNPLNPSCTSHPGWTLGRQVAWSPDGAKILTFGTQNGSNGTVFGLIEFTSNVPFSTQASQWGQGTVVTNTATSGEGVIAGAFSPDGKQLALVSNIGGTGFHLYLTPAGHFKLEDAKAFATAACQVAWRSDSQELAVVQAADLDCTSPLGDIVGVDPSTPGSPPTPMATHAENPAWQPLSLDG
jgi:beta-lactam-binding protein with PASTA domain